MIVRWHVGAHVIVEPQKRNTSDKKKEKMRKKRFRKIAKVHKTEAVKTCGMAQNDNKGTFTLSFQ